MKKHKRISLGNQCLRVVSFSVRFYSWENTMVVRSLSLFATGRDSRKGIKIRIDFGEFVETNFF